MVITDVNQVVYNGDGSTAAWPFTFRIIDATDVKLTIIDSDGTETDVVSDYYVDVANNTVYYPGYAPGAEPPEADQPAPVQAGQKLLIYRELPITQEKNLGEKWPFNVIELGLDKLTMILQQIAGWWDRCLKISPAAEAEHPGFDMTFPIEAGKSFRVNAEGTAFEVSDDPGIYAPIAIEAANRATEAAEAAEAAAALVDIQAVWYDSVADMVASDIPAGNTAGTKGYYAANDGGQALYIVREKTVSDVEDGGSIIFLDNGNVAELILPQDRFYNVLSFGIKPNTGDNYLAIHNMIRKTVYVTGGTLYFPAGKYTTSFTLFIPENTVLTGDGADTELYFDETDTNFGVCVCNAGSNVTIKNIKISQKTTGTFHTGAQPGCIGLGSIAKAQADAEPYYHTYDRVANNTNLTAENLYFGGFYPIQTENSEGYPVHNVTYRNLYCPQGCVSLMPHDVLDNVVVENITCDLLRVRAMGGEVYGLKNAMFRNVVFNSLDCRVRAAADDNVVFENCIQTTGTRYNDHFSSNLAGNIKGNVTFRNCDFNTISGEQSGFSLKEGVKKFYDCTFNAYDKIFQNDVTGDANYNVHERCSFTTSGSNTTVLRGYGNSNTFGDASKYSNYLYGDMYRSKTLSNLPNASSASYPSKLYINGDTVYCSLYLATSLSSTIDASEYLSDLPLMSTAKIPATIWKNTDRSGTVEHVYLSISSGVITVEGATSLTDYNRLYMFDRMILSRVPTPTETFSTFG